VKNHGKTRGQAGLVIRLGEVRHRQINAGMTQGEKYKAQKDKEKETAAMGVHFYSFAWIVL
jgi:hypothetical protein